MGKKVRGWIAEKDGKFYARMDYTDKQGNHIQLKRTGRTKKDAQQILKQLVLERQQAAPTTNLRTFDKLVAFNKLHYIKPAEFIDGNKVAGMKTYKRVLSLLKPIEAHFGKMPLERITYTSLKNYKEKRLKTPIKFKYTTRKQRTFTAVNKELEVLRAMLNVAVQEGAISINPFKQGKPLINKAFEKVRERIMSWEEEQLLLSLCTREGKREHLAPFIIVAVDSGMRPGEMTKIRKKDIHFNAGYIDVVAAISKTERHRLVPISERMDVVLRKLVAGKKDDAFIFNKTAPSKSFRTACRLAKIKGLTLYCLRHTNASRLVKLNTELSRVARSLGHTSVVTTFRYTNQDLESVKMIASAINEYARRSRLKQS